MAVRVLYFAALRDALPLAEESVALPAGVETMAAVSATTKPVTTTFHQLLKKPQLAMRPAM